MTEIRMFETLGIEPYLVSSFCDSCFGFVSIFELRASNFRSCCEPLVGEVRTFSLKEKVPKRTSEIERTHKERVTLSGRNILPCRCSHRTLPSISGPGARLVPVAETLCGRSNLNPLRSSVSDFRSFVLRICFEIRYSCFEIKWGCEAGIKPEIRISKFEGNPKDQIRMFET
jgi:hypothetical protein